MAVPAGFQTTELPSKAGAVGRLPPIAVKLKGVTANTNPSVGPPWCTSARTWSLSCGMTACFTLPVVTSFPPMTIGISGRSCFICSSRTCRLARSGEPGAYSRTGSLRGGGTRKIPGALIDGHCIGRGNPAVRGRRLGRGRALAGRRRSRESRASARGRPGRLGNSLLLVEDRRPNSVVFRRRTGLVRRCRYRRIVGDAVSGRRDRRAARDSLGGDGHVRRARRARRTSERAPGCRNVLRPQPLPTLRALPPSRFGGRSRFVRVARSRLQAPPLGARTCSLRRFGRSS